jgi:hypothetical protein
MFVLWTVYDKKYNDGTSSSRGNSMPTSLPVSSELQGKTKTHQLVQNRKQGANDTLKS